MNKPNRSENYILFDCTYDILNNEPNYRGFVYAFNDGFYLNKGVENVNNYSHDNYTVVYCWFKMFEPEGMKHLPLLDHFNWHTHHAKHPVNFLFYLYAKYPLLGIWLLWIPSLAMTIGCARVKRKNSRGQIEISTSGKILTFLKLRAFNLPITEYFCNKIINNHKDLQGWRQVFFIYHFRERPHIYEAYLKWEARNGN